MTTIDEIKAAVLIEDVIGEDQPLRGNGKFIRGQEHDSLVVNTHDQAYFWNVKGQSGDVISWLENERGMDFKSAVELLAARSGLEPPNWRSEDTATRLAARARDDALTVAARHFVRALREEETGRVARDYCYSRGWTDETVLAAGLGYADGNSDGLRGAFSMYEIDPTLKAATAALRIPGGMLIYPHVERGRVVYLSCRGIGEKKHYNPPVELIGERRLYLNWLYSSQDDLVIVCEGQADAITWGQWGFSAIAVAGVAVNQLLLKTLARHKRVVLALDDDDAGIRATRDIADALGPLARVIDWPGEATDANDWLQQGATAEQAEKLVDAATTWVEILASEAGISSNGNKAERLERMTRQAARMGAFELATMRDSLAGLAGLGLREFDRLVKTVSADIEAETEDDKVMIEQTLVGGMIQIPDSDDWYLVETLYEPPDGAAGMESRGGGRTLLAIRHPDGHISTATHLDVDGVRYLPPMPEVALMTKRVVGFAPHVGPLLKTEELVDEVQALIHKYLDISSFFERMSAYYVLLTWFYDAFNIIPYLRFRGDYGTGKSRGRKVVGGICFRPMRASGASSDAALFRMIDTWRGTLLMEEADYERSDYAQLVVKMLNQGYDREQGIILRCADRSQDFETEAYVCYGPKILAMRGEFSDKALESRCLTEEMRGRTRDDVPRELPREFWTEELPRLQALLVRYRLENWRPDMSKVADDKVINLPIEDRLIQITLSLFAIVDDERLRERLRSYLMEYHQKIVGQRGLTLAAKVLEALVVLDEAQASDNLERKQRDLSVNTIADKVNQLIDFENWGEEDYVKGRTLKGKEGVGSRKVGYILRDDLQLETERQSKFNGRYCVVWDGPRVKSLRKRYGLDDDRLVDLLEINNKIAAMEAEAKENGDQPVPF